MGGLFGFHSTNQTWVPNHKLQLHTARLHQLMLLLVEVRDAKCK